MSKHKKTELSITKDSVRSLGWQPLERLISSGKLTEMVPTKLPRLPNQSSRPRRPKSSVVSDVLLAWPDGVETIELQPSGAKAMEQDQAGA